MRPLDTLFFDSARNLPEAIALIAGGRSWTYRALEGWALRLAGHLRNEGLGKGDRVAVAMEKGPEQVAACLAILSQGGVYVPVDPAMPSPRFSKIAAASGMTLLLTQARLIDRLPEFAGRIVIADESEHNRREMAEPLADRLISDEAYVIYTSGSTGMPKGVLIDHRGAVNTVLDINARFGVTDRDRIFGFSALGFDLSVYDLFGAFAAGAALVLPDAGGIHDPTHWADLVEESGVTIWNSVPAVCDLLVGEASRDLSSLRLVLLSGDWVPLKLPENLRRLVPDVRLIAMGGATEASIWSNWFDVKEVDPAWRSIPYGYPLSNQSYRVLDSQLRDRPDWVIGDLHIGGIGLALGYENDREWTEAAFIRHPDGERLYRTGDMARYWPDGTIEFLGRRDMQVKIAGHRIELGEIEAALTAHPAVREAVVDVVGSENAARRLMAWLLVEDGHDDFHEVITSAPDAAFALEASVKEALSLIVPADGVVNEFLAWQQDLAAQCIQDIFVAAELFSGGETGLAIDDMTARLGLHPDYHGLLPRWLRHIENTGMLKEEGGKWHGTLALSSWDRLEQRAVPLGIPAGVVRRLREISPRLLEVVRGVTDPLEVFYEEQGHLSPEKLARHHPCAIPVHEAIGKAIRAMAGAVARKLKVLEIGARSGAATQDWLTIAGLDAVSAVISDPSGLLLSEAQGQGLDDPTIAWQVFEPQAGLPVEMEAHGFDIVLAFNALHRGDDVDRILSNCRTLLAPSGRLIAVELTVNGPMIDVTAALIERGFRTLADLRKQRGLPLMSGEDWCSRLKVAGFTNAEAIEPGANGDLTVLIGTNVERVARFQPERVMRYLEGMLPAYMVPRQFMQLAVLPLSANGKVDRKRLPIPNEERKAGEEISAPVTGTEQKLVAIWCDLLGHADIGRDANFFAAGGDSLIAVRMVERIRSVFGCKLALRSIFALQELKVLAAHIDESTGMPVEEGGATLSADLHLQFEPFPMTDVQQAYFIGRQPLFPLGGVSTHLFAEIDVTEHSVEALNRAWDKLVQRHGMLRAVIDGDGHQRILPSVPVFSFMTSDLTEGDGHALDVWLERQRRDMSHRVYDTAHWPLFDIRAAKLAGSVRLLVSLDNLICDGRSMVMLLSEWAALARDRSAVLPPLEVSFRDVVLHWEKQEQSEGFSTSLDYWMERLPHLPPGPALPIVRTPAELTPPRFRRLESSLAPEEWTALRTRSAQMGLSANSTLLTAYASCLRAGGGGDVFSLNLTLFRRDPIHHQIDLLVGDFTSLLLVPFDAGDGGSFTDVARTLQDRLMRDLEHAQVSAVRVIREAARRGGDAQALAVPVVFTSGVGVDNTASDGDTADWLGRFTGGITQTPQVWIDHQVVERNGELVFNWDHVDGLFDETWIADVFASYCTLLKQLAADATAWSDLLPVLADTADVLPLHPTRMDPARDVANGGAEGDPAIASRIAELLAAEIGCREIDPSRNFFELGATSLTLLRLHQKLRQIFKQDFPVVTMFSHATVVALATYLAGRVPQPGEGASELHLRKTARKMNAQRRRRADTR